MTAIKIYRDITDSLKRLNDIPLLLIRLVLAYGFYVPATLKWGNINGIADWFESMDIPFPVISAYLSASAEMAGVVLLPLGLATRFISIPLIISMIVAIITVHLGNGFEAGDNGFEIPLYYILMLMVLLFNGAGKFSIDHLITRKVDSKK